MNKYRNSQIYTKTFFPINREKTLNFLQGKNLACAKMAPREEEGCARSDRSKGHLAEGVAVKDFKGHQQTQCFSRIII